MPICSAGEEETSRGSLQRNRAASVISKRVIAATVRYAEDHNPSPPDVGEAGVSSRAMAGSGWVIGVVHQLESHRFTSSNSTQSESPEALLPDGVKSRRPAVGKGEPSTGLREPSVGSYQVAVTRPVSLLRS